MCKYVGSMGIRAQNEICTQEVPDHVLRDRRITGYIKAHILKGRSMPGIDVNLIAFRDEERLECGIID
jgi:hypothetical protein